MCHVAKFRPVHRMFCDSTCFALKSHFLSVFVDKRFRIGKKRVNGAVCRVPCACACVPRAACVCAVCRGALGEGQVVGPCGHWPADVLVPQSWENGRSGAWACPGGLGVTGHAESGICRGPHMLAPNCHACVQHAWEAVS